jgi:inhibitor of KinA sporulation pathway (predicted exonuclease)
LNQSIILFDFEYTAWEGSKERRWSEPWEHREIIQIAALRVELDGTVTETDSFDCLVRPRHNPVLSSYITALTGIEQSDVDSRGVSFPEVFATFYAFCQQGRLPLFCYGDDVSVLLENFTLNDLPPDRFPAGIYDIRATFEQGGIDTRPYTSGTVYQALGIELNNHTAHNALNDVRSLALTLRQLMQMGRLDAGWLERNVVGRLA